jgi:hypothetical protein
MIRCYTSIEEGPDKGNLQHCASISDDVYEKLLERGDEFPGAEKSMN